MTKKIRQQVFDKYNGLCAYTGKLLGDDWQVDHVTSKIKHEYQTYWNKATLPEIKQELKKVDQLSNLLPACKIVNHYKRGFDLEGFRAYMRTFHTRLSKLPKKPTVQKSIKRKAYMLKVAELFDITPDKPFSGIFYFELNPSNDQ